MIHLAKEDIKHSLGKFISTAMGVGMLLGIVLIMMGVYRGMIVDANSLLKDVNADLWVVQEKTLGPFAEGSRINEDLKITIRNNQAIEKSEAITFQNIQLPNKIKPIRVLAVGYDPYGEISPINSNKLIDGRALNNNYYEIVVTDKTGFKVGNEFKLGRNIYNVVGVTTGTVSSGGEALVFISLKNAQELQFSYSNKRIQSDRARGINAKPLHMANAIIATIKPGYNPDEVANELSKWKHKSVYTKQAQYDILTKNVVETAAKQIGLFTMILILVSVVIIGLIIFTMTLEKMKEISIMKLLGIPNYSIIRMIVEETLILSVFAFIFGNAFAHFIYDKFPKRVVLELPDAFILLIVVIIASVFASMVGVKQVIQADPARAIGG